MLAKRKLIIRYNQYATLFNNFNNDRFSIVPKKGKGYIKLQLFRHTPKISLMKLYSGKQEAK